MEITLVEFNIQKFMKLEDWKDHVLGSGCTYTYPWWHDIDENSVGDVKLTHWYDSDIGDYEEHYGAKPFIHWTTYGKLALTASRVAADHGLVREAILNDDFDADAMDIVLQKDAFGEVIFG